MLLRVETEPQRLLRYIDEWDYPFEWNLEGLTDNILMRVGPPENPLVYIWAQWIEEPALAMLCHICSAPARSHEWSPIAVHSDLVEISRFLGADYLAATPMSSRCLAEKRLLRRLGYQTIDDFTYYFDLRDNEQDPTKTEDHNPPGFSAGTGTA